MRRFGIVRRSCIGAMLTGACLAWLAVAAGAAVAALPTPSTATIGSVADASGGFIATQTACVSAVQDQTDPASPQYVVPFDGFLVRWSLRNSAGPFQGQPLDATAQAQVFRQVEAERWLLVDESSPRTIAPEALGTFHTLLPVRAGDVLGLRSSYSCTYTSRLSTDDVLTFGAHPAPGDVIAPDGPGASAWRLNVSAVVLSCRAKHEQAPKLKPCR